MNTILTKINLKPGSINMNQMNLGVCYYPEHWSQNQWNSDLTHMKKIGIDWVRIGEFAWSILQPQENQFNFSWLDQVMDLFHHHRLKVVLGTPTATPPFWMIKKYPDLSWVDEEGRLRKFGSRRHYCFSHSGYLEEVKLIVEKLAQRYSKHPALQAWQTDNEYGCHDTALSYSRSAQLGFQNWLVQKYKTIQTLNHEWGNLFWSMLYENFSDIDLPNLTVAEPNPAQVLDFHRYSSDQVIRFNQAQVKMIKKYSRAPIIHNYLGGNDGFDHFELSKDLEIVSWDSYPLGSLARQESCFESQAIVDSKKEYFLNQGDPDFQAFNHELFYRAGQKRFWVMEQQPGPVNWAPYNPVPSAGMIRLWTWEAFFHGAEVVSYFRWKQAPWAQEQMHAGLLRTDGSENQAVKEIEQVKEEVRELKKNLEQNPSNQTSAPTPSVALVYDYTSQWAWKIQPQIDGFSYLNYLILLFKVLRSRGISVTIIPPTTKDFTQFKIVFIPLLFTWTEELSKAIEKNKTLPLEQQTTLIIGPRTGGKTKNFQNNFHTPIKNFPIVVEQVHTFPNTLEVRKSNRSEFDSSNSLKSIGHFKLYQEFIKLDHPEIELLWETKDEKPALIRYQKDYYLTGCGDEKLLEQLVSQLVEGDRSYPKFPGLEKFTSKGLRICFLRERPDYLLILNYGKELLDLDQLIPRASYLIGNERLNPSDIAIIKI